MIFCQQRYTVAEKNYNELNYKYSEVQTAKQALEKEVMNLQANLDHERSSRTHASEDLIELQGLLVHV